MLRKPAIFNCWCFRPRYSIIEIALNHKVLHQSSEAEFTILMSPDTFADLNKATLSLHMRTDLFSVTGSPPGRLDWVEEELGSEIKEKEELE